MKKLINEVGDFVPEMLEGLVAGAPGLVLLDSLAGLGVSDLRSLDADRERDDSAA